MDERPPTIDAAAERLGISSVEVLHLMRDGALRYVVVDWEPHVPADAIDEYLREHPETL